MGHFTPSCAASFAYVTGQATSSLSAASAGPIPATRSSAETAALDFSSTRARVGSPGATEREGEVRTAGCDICWVGVDSAASDWRPAPAGVMGERGTCSTGCWSGLIVAPAMFRVNCARVSGETEPGTGSPEASTELFMFNVRLKLGAGEVAAVAKVLERCALAFSEGNGGWYLSRITIFVEATTRAGASDLVRGSEDVTYNQSSSNTNKHRQCGMRSHLDPRTFHSSFFRFLKSLSANSSTRYTTSTKTYKARTALKIQLFSLEV